MFGLCIARKGASKWKRSKSIRTLLLFTTHRVFNQERTLKEEVVWQSHNTLRTYGDGEGYYSMWSRGESSLLDRSWHGLIDVWPPKHQMSAAIALEDTLKDVKMIANLLPGRTGSNLPRQRKKRWSRKKSR